MTDLEDIVEGEWLEWYGKTPEERFTESLALFRQYREMGGTLEPDIDRESPFWDCQDLDAFSEAAARDRERVGIRLQERHKT